MADDQYSDAVFAGLDIRDVWACLVAACERYYCRFFVLGDLQAGDAQDVYGGERGTLEVGDSSVMKRGTLEVA